MANFAKMVMIIDNSPIGFILLGPENIQYPLVARSSNALLNLGGSYLNSVKLANKSSIKYSLLKVLALDYPYEEFSSVKSRNVRFINDNEANSIDINKSNSTESIGFFTLCWEGNTTEKEKELIEKSLNMYVDDLKKAIVAKSSEDLGWYLSPTIILCAKFNYKYKLRLKLLRISLIALTLLFVVLPVVSIYFSWIKLPILSTQSFAPIIKNWSLD